jgi:hypothetical protein
LDIKKGNERVFDSKKIYETDSDENPTSSNRLIAVKYFKPKKKNFKIRLQLAQQFFKKPE